MRTSGLSDGVANQLVPAAPSGSATWARIAYNCALVIALPFVAAWFLARTMFRRNVGSALSRLRGDTFPLRSSDAGKPAGPSIWVHAVSAGEVAAAAPIVEAIRALRPGARIHVSVVTDAGFGMVKKQMQAAADSVGFIPFDTPSACRRAAARINPDLFIALESDLWPNLLDVLHGRGCRTAMANGRISDRSARRAGRYGRWLYGWILSNVDGCFVQGDGDQARLLELGAEAGRVTVLGNSKFDQQTPRPSPSELQDLRTEYGLSPGDAVLVAGSTRSEAEERIVIEAWNVARVRVPSLKLVIAPRHAARGPAIARLVAATGRTVVRRSDETARGRTADCLVLDTMGELARAYAVATVCFVGNSFPPVVKGGGQNVLQPLAQGKPLLYGPLTRTAAAEVELAEAAGVGFRVTTAGEFGALVADLVLDRERLAGIDQRAVALMDANRGVAVRYAEAVLGLLT